MICTCGSTSRPVIHEGQAYCPECTGMVSALNEREEAGKMLAQGAPRGMLMDTVHQGGGRVMMGPSFFVEGVLGGGDPLQAEFVIPIQAEIIKELAHLAQCIEEAYGASQSLLNMALDLEEELTRSGEVRNEPSQLLELGECQPPLMAHIVTSLKSLVNNVQEVGRTQEATAHYLNRIRVDVFGNAPQQPTPPEQGYAHQ